MAIYRQIYMSFWTDPKIDEDFTPEDKYFYLYLMTNPHTNICGCYECGVKQMARETGYNEDTIKRLLDRMKTTHNVVDYDYSTKEVLILNWHKYNLTSSEDTLKGALKVANYIKSNDFKRYIYSVIEEKGNGSIETPYTPPLDPPQTSVSDSVSVSNTASNYVSNNFNNNISSKVKEEIERAVLAWNALGISKVTKIPQNSDRYKQLKKRIEEYGIDEVLRAIQVVGRSDFLNGTNDKGWNATFDWLVKPNNFLKVIEGNYDRSNKVQKNQQAQELDDFYRMTDEWVRSHENDV